MAFRSGSNRALRPWPHSQGPGKAMSMILVVDDDPGNRLLLRGILEMQGHSVIEAANGEAALDVIGPGPPPDIVITDLAMPVLNGVQLIKRLQSEPRTAAIPIVVVSGDYEVAGALKMSGWVEAVVRKPISSNALSACVGSFATTHRRSDTS